MLSSHRFGSLLEFEGDVRSKILSQLAIFLCHRFPIVSTYYILPYPTAGYVFVFVLHKASIWSLYFQVRKCTASKLFESILVVDDLVAEENLDELNSLLSETQW